MGLDIGIISIEYLEQPKGDAYRFAWELAVEASTDGYMAGEGNNWAAFTQRQVLRMLNQFSESRSLDTQSKNQVLDWVRSLPWDEWQDDFDPSSPTDEDDEDYNPILDSPNGEDGGIIELHFNW